MKRSNETERRLTGLWKRQEAVTKRLADAQEKLANARQVKSDFVSSARSGMASQATVLNAGNSASAIATSLGVQVVKVKEFASMLKQLRDMGYGRNIVAQVAGAGVEGGWQAAQALIAADPTQVKTIRQSFQTIQDVAGNTAQKLGAEMYDSGIRAAQGLVKGLRDRRNEVEATIRHIAESMQRSLMHALGLKVPQRQGRDGSDGHDGKGGKGGHGGDGHGGHGGQGGRGQGVAHHAYVDRAGMSGQAARHQRRLLQGDTRDLTPSALQGGQRAGASVSFTFVTHNPQAEPQSRTVNKALARVASLSLV